MPDDNTPALPLLKDIVSRLTNKESSGEVTRERERLERRYTKTSNNRVVLADLSASMLGEPLRRLKAALADAIQHHPDIHIIGFNSNVYDYGVGRINLDEMRADSCTNLKSALEYVSRLRPYQTILVSDGLPDSPESALEMAENLTGTIDVVFCGKESDYKAVAFMSSLTRLSGGRNIKWDLNMKLELEHKNPIRGLLA